MQQETFVLESERLVFKKIENNDFPVIAEIMRDKSVQEVWEHYFSDDDVKEWISRRKKGYEDNGMDYLLAIHKRTGKPVGQIGLLKETINNEAVWGIGYILLSHFCENGYATEGANAMADYAFRTLNADRIVCDIRPMNTASIAVAKRIGMIETGSFIKKYRGKDMPHLIFELRNKTKNSM